MRRRNHAYPHARGHTVATAAPVAAKTKQTKPKQNKLEDQPNILLARAIDARHNPNPSPFVCHSFLLRLRESQYKEAVASAAAFLTAACRCWNNRRRSRRRREAWLALQAAVRGRQARRAVVKARARMACAVLLLQGLGRGYIARGRLLRSVLNRTCRGAHACACSFVHARVSRARVHECSPVRFFLVYAFGCASEISIVNMCSS